MPTQLPIATTQALNAQLLAAAGSGNVAAIERAVRSGADVNVKDGQGRTSAMVATHADKPDALRALVRLGADINTRDGRSDNPFLYAGAEGLPRILDVAIEAGADTRLANRFGGTALIPAAERGHVDIVRTLLQRTDVDVNHVNNLGWTALLEAIVLSDGGERHQRIVQLLVDHGADIAIGDKNGVTPLQHARNRGYREIERILLAAATRPTPDAARDQQLIAASRAGDIGLVRRLLAQGARVTARDARGATALVAAAYRNDLAVAELLIKAGADVNAKDDTQQSAYLIATSDGFVELLRRTLRAGADVHGTDSYNGTGLIRAADRGHVEVIRELLKAPIRVDHVNRLGWTALLEAIILGDGGPRHTEVVRLLVEAGADVNLADLSGVTPLQHAQRRGFAHIEALLRGAGGR